MSLHDRLMSHVSKACGISMKFTYSAILWLLCVVAGRFEPSEFLENDELDIPESPLPGEPTFILRGQPTDASIRW